MFPLPDWVQPVSGTDAEKITCTAVWSGAFRIFYFSPVFNSL